jgi:hypothetical protein
VDHAATVDVVKPLASSDGASYVHVLDNSGNEIVLAHLPDDEGRPSAYALIEE